MNIAFRTTNTVQQHSSERQTNKNPSEIYELKCKTCNNVYVGQSGRSINIRHKEHIRYIRTNNPLSAYALHILQNRQEYGTIADTLQLLKTRRKGTRMPSQAKVLTGGGDLREAQVDVPLSVSHSCV